MNGFGKNVMAYTDMWYWHSNVVRAKVDEDEARI